MHFPALFYALQPTILVCLFVVTVGLSETIVVSGATVSFSEDASGTYTGSSGSFVLPLYYCAFHLVNVSAPCGTIHIDLKR
jgi:hypothetical protein